MSANTPLERKVATWMTDEVSGRVPDALLDDILATTGRLRPDRRWLALLKEPPMRVHSLVAVGSPTRRLTAGLALALLVLAATAAVVGAFLLRGPTVSADDWPAFRGDLARAGVAVRGPVGRPVLQWRYQVAGGAVRNNLAIVGDLVYASSDDGPLHALALADGKQRWAFRGGQAPLTGPTVVGGTVYVFDAKGQLFALDAASGQQRWQSASSLTGAINPTIGAGRLYVGTADGFLVALDATSGAELWRFAVAPSGIVNAPAFADGLVYAGSLRGGFVAVDASTGKLAWRLDTGTDALGTAVVAAGIVYIGAPSDSTAGHLWALDARSGAILWQLNNDLGAPAVAGHVAYTSNTLGLVAALDTATGRELWRFQVHGAPRAPAVAGGVVYVDADIEHRVYALDAATGGELWQFDVDSSNQCCIAVAKGSVFVATVTGSIYDIGGDGSVLTPAPASPSAAATPAPSTSSAVPSATPLVSPSSGAEPVQFLWKAAGTGGNFSPNNIVRDAAGQIWAVDPSNDRFGIFTADGSFVEYWGQLGTGNGQFHLVRSNGDGYGSIAFEPDGSFFVLDAGNRRIQAFDAKRRFVRTWGTFGTGPGQYNDPVGIVVGPDGSVYVLDDVRGVIEKYDRTGKVLATFDGFVNATDGFNTANALAIDKAGNLYVSDIQPGQVERLDPTGKLTMTYGSPGPGPGQFIDQPGAMAIDSTGRLFVDQGAGRVTQPGVLVFDKDGGYLTGFGSKGPADGQITWPTGLFLDGAGNLYVGDGASNADNTLASRIEKFRLLPPLGP